MRRFLLAAVTVLVVATASAQERRLRFGIKGAATVSSSSVMDSWLGRAALKTFIGYSYGFFMEIPLANVLSLQPEVLVSTRGFGIKWDTQDSYENSIAIIKNKLYNKYIDLPVIMKVYVTNNLSLDVGPQFGFAVRGYTSGKIIGDKTINEDYEGNKSISVIGEKMYSKFDFALSFGVTYNVKKVFFNVRYNFGLTNAFKESKSEYLNAQNVYRYWSETYNSKVYCFQFGMGYRF